MTNTYARWPIKQPNGTNQALNQWARQVGDRARVDGVRIELCCSTSGHDAHREPAGSEDDVEEQEEENEEEREDETEDARVDPTTDSSRSRPVR